jgi:hypothetical protein
MQFIHVTPLAKNCVAVATSDNTIRVEISETADGLLMSVRKDVDSIPTRQMIRIDRDLAARVELVDETKYQDISSEIPA